MRPIASREPFELMTFRAPPGVLWQKWHKLEVDLLAEDKVIARCRAEPENCAAPGARRFIAIVDDARAHSGRARIDVVNRAINDAVSYTSDLAQHGVPDLWSAPLATLTTKRGDCEDYAIAKFVALQQAGVSQTDLRLLLVRDRAVRQDHAVLAVRHNDHWLLLDNRYSLLLDEKDAAQLTPLFALDHSGVKLFASRYTRLLEGAPIDATPAAWPRGEATALKEDDAAPISGGRSLPLVF
jgi:predicted transglutaminase-like cysteine proteinase